MKASRDCIQKCKQGDRIAQRELFDLSLPYLNAICGRYLFDLSFRQDIMQESFAQIFQSIDQYDEHRGEFHSWASRIVINKCLMFNRANKRKASTLGAAIIEQHGSCPPEVLSQMSYDELVAFLKKMPIKFYEVFSLFAVDGFNHAEIAKKLNIKESLSRKRLVRARAWLQNQAKEPNNSLGEFQTD